MARLMDTLLIALSSLATACSLFPTRQTACSQDRACPIGQYCRPDTATCEASPAVEDMAMAVDLDTSPDMGTPVGMLLIPGGTFNMGSPVSDLDSSTDERPEHDVTVAPFFFDITEVTQGEYRKCVNSGSCTNPDDFNITAECNWGKSAREDHPVNCIDWNQAKTYCGWKSARLPTEEEWEYVARGATKSKFPYGNDPAINQGCIMQPNGTCIVGLFNKTLFGRPNGNGLSDMLGNVAEWTSTIYCTAYDLQGCTSNYVVRGGGYNGDPNVAARAAWRGSRAPQTFRGPGLGVRCAKNS